MIWEGIVSAFAAVVRFVLGLFPSIADPAWLRTGVGGAVSTVTSHLTGLGAWVPFGTFATVVDFVVLACGVALTIKLVRIVASFFLAGGGSAA